MTKSSINQITLVTKSYDLGTGGIRTNTITDANSNKIINTLDFRGNTLSTLLPAGGSYSAASIKNAYDKSGFLISSIDAAGKQTTYIRNNDGTVKSITNALAEKTSFEYDIFGNQAKTTKPSGAISTHTYDDLNRLTSVVDATGNTTTFEYDANHNLLHQYLPGTSNGKTTHVEYTYDKLNRKLSHTQYGSSNGELKTTYVYDAEGNLTKITDAKGQVFGNGYDELNRLITQSFPASSDVSSITTAYDANGNVTTITEDKSSGAEITTQSYDLLNRLTERTQRGHTVTYDYDNNGNRTQVTSPGGTTNYAFDSRNRLVSATSGAKTTTYSYLQNNWLKSVNYANGTTASYTHDDAGRVTSIINNLADRSVLSSFNYTYDTNGNRTQQIETQNGFSDSQTLTTTYDYDTLDRLISYTENGPGYNKSHAFTYYPSYDRRTETVTDNGRSHQQAYLHLRQHLLANKYRRKCPRCHRQHYLHL